MMNIYKKTKNYLQPLMPFLTNWLICFLLFVFWFTIDFMVQHDNIRLINLGGFIYIVRGVISWSLLFSSLVLFLGKYSKFILYPIFLLIFIVEISELFVRINFNMKLTGNIVFILMVSSFQEMFIFLKNYWLFATLILLCFISYCVLCFYFISQKNVFPPEKKSILVGGTMVIMFLINYNFIFINPEGVLDTSLFTFLCKDIIVNVSNSNSIIYSAKNPILPKNIRIIQPVPEYKNNDKFVGIFCLGESSSRNYWQLYGYPRITTPCLNKMKDDLLVFNDVCGSEPVTFLAMHKLFSQATVANPSNFKCTIVDIYKKAGFKVIFISNQYKWGNLNGEQNSIMIALLEAADETIYTYDLPEDTSNNRYDECLLVLLKKKLEQYRGSNIIFILQLVGSHFPPQEYYPSSFTRYPEDFIDAETKDLSSQQRSLRNHYDNSIAYSDYIISSMCDILKREKSRSFLFYISDHGETPNAKSWRCFTDIDLWELPMILWLSESYKEAYPSFVMGAQNNVDKPMQSEFLFEGLISMAQITYEDFPHSKDVFNQYYIPPKERFIQNGSVKYFKRRHRK